MPESPTNLLKVVTFELEDDEAASIVDRLYEGPTKVERRVPMLPFSREVTRLAWLQRGLTVYRLAFGQPGQDELLAHLVRLLGKGADATAFEGLQIRLHP